MRGFDDQVNFLAQDIKDVLRTLEIKASHDQVLTVGAKKIGAESVTVERRTVFLNEQNQRLSVFLCHSHADKPQVRNLYAQLRQDGFAPWLDEEDLIAGEDWQQVIPTVVRASDAVVVCLSKSSVTREGYVQKEIKYALDAADEKPPGAIFLIPARLDDKVDVPEHLGRWHWVDLFQDRGYKKLILALNTRASSIGINVFPSRISFPSVSESPKPNDPFEPTTVEDFILQVEIYLQYGMKSKAKQRLELINKLYPGRELKNDRLRQFYEDFGFIPKRKQDR
jgi:TIR domain